MNNFKEVREVLKKLDDGIPEYIASNLRWLRIKSTIKEVSKYIPKNAKVLDIGCGMGYNTIMLKIFRPDITIIGIEPSVIEEGRVIANVWKQYTQKGCNYKNGNALHLKSKNEFFDVVISFGVLEHIREYYDFFFEKKVFKDEELRFMQEANRVLKKGGINIITNLPNQYSRFELEGETRGRLLLHSAAGRPNPGLPQWLLRRSGQRCG